MTGANVDKDDTHTDRNVAEKDPQKEFVACEEDRGADTVEKVIESLGEFGLFQRILLAVCLLTEIPAAGAMLLMAFAGAKSPWRCYANATGATVGSTTVSPGNATNFTMNECTPEGMVCPGREYTLDLSSVVTEVSRKSHTLSPAHGSINTGLADDRTNTSGWRSVGTHKWRQLRRVGRGHPGLPGVLRRFETVLLYSRVRSAVGGAVEDGEGDKSGQLCRFRDRNREFDKTYVAAVLQTQQLELDQGCRVREKHKNR
jgi:hypothetical protein